MIGSRRRDRRERPDRGGMDLRRYPKPVPPDRL